MGCSVHSNRKRKSEEVVGESAEKKLKLEVSAICCHANRVQLHNY